MYNRQHASFLSLGKSSHSSLSVYQLPKCFPLCVQCHEIQLRVFLMGSFGRYDLTPSLIPVSTYAFPKLPWLRLSNTAVTAPTLSNDFCNNPDTQFEFHFPCYCFSFLCASLSLSACSLSQGPIFVKHHTVCHWEARRQQSHTLCCLCVSHLT